jgi:hypothetical protein
MAHVTPLKRAVLPVALKFVPVMVTVSPPLTDPYGGTIPVMWLVLSIRCSTDESVFLLAPSTVITGLHFKELPAT